MVIFYRKSQEYIVRGQTKIYPLGAVRKSKNCKQDKKTAPSCKFSYFTKQVKENATGRSFDFFKQSGNPIFALKIVKTHKKCGFFGTPSGNTRYARGGHNL